MRVESFSKSIIITGNTAANNKSQPNKFSIICDDGFVCRADDTGFASVKGGDLIEFRGFPEFGSFEEFGKCDRAQLLRVIPQQ